VYASTLRIDVFARIARELDKDWTQDKLATVIEQKFLKRRLFKDIHVTIQVKSASQAAAFKVIFDTCGLDLLVTLKGNSLIVSGIACDRKWCVSALQVSIGFIEILADHDKDFFNIHDTNTISSVLRVLLNLSSYSDFINLVKYSTGWMHARSLKQKVLPELPSFWKGGAPLLFSGSIRRFLKNRIVSGGKPVNQHLFWSVAQLKRCAAVVPDDFVQSSLEKHQAAMTKDSKVCHPLFLDQFKLKLDQVISSMRRDADVSRICEYSSSACFEQSRCAGGAKAFLMKNSVVQGDTSDDELLKMDFCPYKGLSERRGYITQDFNTVMLDYQKREEYYKPCEAKVYSICEPLKIRNITASNAYPYALASGMQKWMHTSLKSYRQFQLIGEPLDSNFVNDFLLTGKPGDKIASGDFSAATDNIKIELTKLTFERMLTELIHFNDLSLDHADVLRKVLYEHIINYPNFSLLQPVRQVNGQLMGSVLSFPILCIINLITYWIAVEPNVERFQDLNVMVNGDDIMFKCSDEQYQDWLDTLEQAGLTPSPGKNFFHEKFGTVNSALFFQKGSIGKQVTQYIPFFNVGMLLGQSKVARVSEEECDKPIHCLHQHVMEGSLNKVRADSRFRVYNKEILIKSSTMYDGTVLNWYLPRSIGGLGMHLPDGFKFRDERSVQKANTVLITDRQRVIAYGLRESWYKDDLTKIPFKPIGFLEDPDIEQWGDIRRRTALKVQFRDCPMLPECDMLPNEYHPPNWYLPSVGVSEKECLRYIFKGLNWKRFSKVSLIDSGCLKYCVTKNEFLTEGKKFYNMIKIDNNHLFQELVVYKKRSSRVIREVPSGALLKAMVDPIEDYYL